MHGFIIGNRKCIKSSFNSEKETDVLLWVQYMFSRGLEMVGKCAKQMQFLLRGRLS